MKSTHLEMAQNILLSSSDLSEHQLQQMLSGLLGSGVDYADIYFQALRSESWSLEDGIVKDASYEIERGVGVRAISGERTGFAYSDDIELGALQQAASAAKSISLGSGSAGPVSLLSKPLTQILYPALDPLPSMTTADKIALLQRLDQVARQKDPRVVQVMASLSAVFEVIMVLTGDGELLADVRPLVRINASVIVEDKGRREQGYAGGGGRGDYQQFLQDETALSFVDEAVREALVNLEAIAAPAGAMPVVLGPGWPGVLLHEAVGHGLEGDFNRKGTSAFAGRIGQRVAAPGCTVVDDGTLAGRRGSLNMDDEGTVTQKTVLIEDGFLRCYMQDRLNAKLMGVPRTGNGRRESYAHLPMPRMTNTYMLPGDYAAEEIIASVDKGIYAVNFGGGQVDITSGKFVFSASEAYLIEKGQVTAPIKGATLIGSGPQAMPLISMIGNDLALDKGVGVCGKDGQSVPVGVGQPTLKVDELTVGGTG